MALTAKPQFNVQVAGVQRNQLLHTVLWPVATRTATQHQVGNRAEVRRALNRIKVQNYRSVNVTTKHAKERAGLGRWLGVSALAGQAAAGRARTQILSTHKNAG